MNTNYYTHKDILWSLLDYRIEYTRRKYKVIILEEKAAFVSESQKGRGKTQFERVYNINVGLLKSQEALITDTFRVKSRECFCFCC